jgi:probable F420-dependent oxidoreductase
MKLMFPMPHLMEIAAVTQKWEHAVTGPDQLRLAARAEALGYDMIAVPEHYAVPPGDQHTGAFWLHSTTAQAAMAGATRRIMLNSSVTILPFTSPIVHAKALATADWLSGGRMAVTFGLGSIEQEYAYFGVPWRERGAIADEYLEAIVALWTQERPTYHGKYVQFEDIGFQPKPVQKPHLPIWIGGDSKAALRRVARFASGWIVTFRTRPEAVPDRLDAIRSAPAWTERPLEVAYSLSNLKMVEGHGSSGASGPDPTSAQQLIDALGALRDCGITMSAVPIPPVASLEAYLDHAQWVMEEVRPRL